MKKALSLAALVVALALVAVVPAAARTHTAAAGEKGALTASSSGGVTTLTGCGYQNHYAVTITVTDSAGVSQSEIASDAGQNCVTASFALSPGGYSARATQDVDGGNVRLNYPVLSFTVA